MNKLELFILGITGFFIYNTYHEGFYMEWIQSRMKYAKMGMYALIGISIIIMIRKNPIQSTSFLKHAHEMIHYIPMDSNMSMFVKPMVQNTIESYCGGGEHSNIDSSSGFKQGGGGGGKSQSHQRSVSQARKRYVASSQQWKCHSCQDTLDHTYEIDHIIELQHGGTNEVDNLVALCRNCHGRKTYMNKI